MPASSAPVSATRAKPRLLAFGEILWDVFAEREVIGGAPFNVAAHAAACGLDAALYGSVGSDLRGQRARAEVKRLRVDDRWLRTDPRRETGRVDVLLDPQGQPEYRFAADVAYDAIEGPDAPGGPAIEPDQCAVLVCGTLAQRAPQSRRALAQLRAKLRGVPVFYDVNLRGAETPLELVRATLPGVTVLKVNEEEAQLLARERLGRPGDLTELFRRLRADDGLELLVCTRGAAGCTVVAPEQTLVVPSEPVSVVSAVGAGDAFSAAFIAGWLGGRSLEAAARAANRLGGFVASRAETVPEYPADWVA